MAFRHFVNVRQEGLAAALGVGHQAISNSSELPMDEFLRSLLDAIYFEANSFGDEWEIKLPGVGPRTRMEELQEGFGPEIGIAPAPGRAPRIREANIGAGPLPPGCRDG